MNNISAESLGAFQSVLARQNLATSVLAKANEAARAEGQAAVELIEAAAETAKRSPDSGSHHLDVVA